MSKIRVYNLGSLQLKVSPFLHVEGDMIRCLNFEKDSIGGLKKRPGYATYLGTPDNDEVTSLFSWLKNDSTTLYTYRYSGSVLYYSTDGTGVWTVCGNGTMTDSAHIGYAVLDDTMIIGDGTAATRHTTDGTDFTNTTAAPLAEHFEEYQGRIWAARGTATSGTATDIIFSTVGTASDWSTDSSSVRIPGPGRVNALIKSGDRLLATKDSGQMYRYDGYNLVDMSTNLGPSSAYSIAKIEDTAVYLNRKGFHVYNGERSELISVPIERQVYNTAGNGIQGTTFDNAPASDYKYNYFCSVGTVKDDLTDEEVADCVMNYDFRHNEWINWKFANRPTAMHSYRDSSGDEKFIFGDSGGQCYTLGGTDLNDNASTIEAVAEGVLHFGVPETDKKFNYIWAFTNPGAQANIQVAIADTFTKQYLKWMDLKQLKDGVMEARFPEGSRGKLLFWKVYEASKEASFQFYGFTVDADFIERK